MSDRLHVLVLADRDGIALWPLTESLPNPLLPIAGRPLIDHVLATLSECGPLDVTLCLSPEDLATATYVTQRTYPGLAITISGPVDAAPKTCLAIRADILPSPDGIRSCLALARRGHGAGANRSDLGIWHVAAGKRVPPYRYSCVMAEGNDRMLPTLAAYWRICLAAQKGDLNELVPGLRAKSLVDPRRDEWQNTRKPASATRTSRGRPSVDDVVVGPRAVVHPSARVERCVVMQDTQIGPNVALKDAIVSGPWICRMDTGDIFRAAEIADGRRAA
jgi:hypothetical protein